MKPKILIFVDADNTLWDTNAVFERAQLKLIEWIHDEEPARNQDISFKKLREVDQAIAQGHPKGLRYPIKLLVGELRRIATERNTCSDKVPMFTNSVNDENLGNKYYAMLNSEAPVLFPAIVEGLDALNGKARLVLLSEGGQDRIPELLRVHGLAHYFQAVEYVKEKNSEEFARLKNQYTNLLTTSVWSIGDQLHKDIGPAHEIGLKTVFVPGGFESKWNRAYEGSPPTYTASNFNDAAKFILERGGDEFES